MRNPSLENLTTLEDHIVIIGDNYQAARVINSGWESGSVERIPASRVFTGEPFQVVGVNAPFICCKVVGESDVDLTIDIRHVQWRKVDHEYVKGYMYARGLLEFKPTKEEVQAEKDSKKRCCPLCVEPMIERKGVRTGWKMICKNCDVQLTRIKK